MNLAVLINTCDKFQDCWDPFFQIWKKFGLRSVPHVLYLNTERKQYERSDLKIVSLAVCEANHWSEKRPPSWSWCLSHALEAMREEYVLYMQEDYFLVDQMDDFQITNILQTMKDHSEIRCVHLTRIGISKTRSCEFDGLDEGEPEDWYFVSCQAAIWRKNILQDLLRVWENAWQFERWATKRARKQGYRFFVAHPSDKGAMPIRYVETGIIQGKWFEPVVDVFKKEGICIDYTKRGFYEGKYGVKDGRWLAWHWTRFRYNVRAFANRYFLPVRSWIEIHFKKS